NVYQLVPAADNPLFEGHALLEHDGLLAPWPANWRANYQTWQPRSLRPSWPTPVAIGNVRTFNDYPWINLTRPAFSQRAADLLRDILEPNGELLPMRHKIGTYYYYNCTQMSNCVDLTRSRTTKVDNGIISNLDGIVFIDEIVEQLTIFKIRTRL